jgi:hypothetical protein
MSVQTTSSVLEEVLEHGPLFDEMEDEAWWSGVDVVDTALRSWPEPGPISDLSGLLAVSTSALTEEEDFCRFWQSHGRQESSGSSLPAEACSLMNRALAVDLSGGSSSMLLLPRLPPPPPVPPTLTDLVKQLNQLSQLQQEQQSQPNNVGSNNDSECLLCQWATLNGTIDLLPNSGKALLLLSIFPKDELCQSPPPTHTPDSKESYTKDTRLTILVLAIFTFG